MRRATASRRADSPNGTTGPANGDASRLAVPTVPGMPSNTPSPIVALRGLGKTFPAAAGRVQALAGIDLAIDRGEFVAITGASGSGKTTLLHLLAGIERASEGEITVAGTALNGLDERALTAWRGDALGIVFQFFQLLPTLTAIENVMLPMDLRRRWPAAQRRPRAQSLLERLGVADQADKFPAAMSGGQQQRVALARALANAPSLLLADEPTGNLDSRSAGALLDLLAGLVRDDGLTVVMVSHELQARDRASRTIRLADGRLLS